MKLPDGFTLRSPKMEDAPAVTELICLTEIQEYGEPDYSVDDLYSDWRRDGFVLERDVTLIHAPDGTLAGYSNIWDRPGYTRVDPASCIHPKYKGKRLEEFLLDHCEAWARRFSATQPPVIQFIVNADNPSKVARLRQRDYAEVHHDWVMEICLTQEPPSPVVPHGIALRAFQRERDERAVWVCIQEAFRDHWRHQDLAFQAWSSWLMDHPDWRPELSFLAVEGDQVVGATMSALFANGGGIWQLGVRRQWRKRGIGLALLHRIFREFYVLGVTRVGLSVDAASLTGATRLYERAGMRVKKDYVRFEKRLD